MNSSLNSLLNLRLDVRLEALKDEDCDGTGRPSNSKARGAMSQAGAALSLRTGFVDLNRARRDQGWAG